MASIGNVQLTITESDGVAAASVTYTLLGSAEDVQLHQNYTEVVELIGSDPRPLEDGRDDPLPVTKAEGSVVFTNTSSIGRSKLFAMPASALNEDLGPTFLGRDEIKARVTLTPVPTSIRRDSNIVTRFDLSVATVEVDNRAVVQQ